MNVMGERLRQLIRVRGNVIQHPVGQDTKGRVEVVHEQCKTLGCLWGVFPLQRWGDLLALACVKLRDSSVVLKRATG